ncbi:MAG: hypothetical protein V3R80_08400, partial [Candidatus Tectomicrobia bacterium]
MVVPGRTDFGRRARQAIVVISPCRKRHACGHVDGSAWDRRAEAAFQDANQRVVIGCHERICFALALGSTGTSDAVRVGVQR